MRTVVEGLTTSSDLLEWLAARTPGLDLQRPFGEQGIDALQLCGLVQRATERFGRAAVDTRIDERVTPLQFAQAFVDGRPSELAVVGMSIRAAGVDSLASLWSTLRRGIDRVDDMGSRRWDSDALHDPDRSALGRTITRRAALLDRVADFDPLFFGISPREAAAMDPQQRLALELAWEAVDDAGLPAPALWGSRTGVFMGAIWHDYADLATADLEAIAGHTATGHSLNMVAHRVSFALGLRGPSLVVDTGCSASLVALHLAAQSLRQGDCSIALVGGVNLVLAAATSVGLSKFGGLSPDGTCKAFDARADGFGRGEGGAVVVIRPLRDALRDGDRIWCVLRGSFVNNDGPSRGLTAPEVAGQTDMLRGACLRAGVPPSTIHYVECHGTGTSVGDPVEARALGEALGRDRSSPLRIGSLKTNFGHLEGAAGVAGLVKAAVAMQERLLPPSLHFDTPNPAIPFEELGLSVVARAEEWSGSEPARAGVSSFGWGGTNAHAIIEAAPDAPILLARCQGSDGERLRASLSECANALTEPCSLGEARAALSTAALRERYRQAFVGRTVAELRSQLSAALDHPIDASAGEGLGLAFGELEISGREVERLLVEPAFRAAFERCDRVFRVEHRATLLDPSLSENRLALRLAAQLGIEAVLASWGLSARRRIGRGASAVSIERPLEEVFTPDGLEQARAAEAAGRVAGDEALSSDLVWLAVGSTWPAARVTVAPTGDSDWRWALWRARAELLTLGVDERTDERPVLVSLSAKSTAALTGSAGALSAWLADRPDVALEDLSFTTLRRRTHHRERATIVASSSADLRRALDALASDAAHPALARGRVSEDAPGKLAFVFPGQGSQWPAMGRRLLAQEPAFAAALRRCDRAIQNEGGASPLQLLQRGDGFEHIGILQPTLFAIEIALAELWRSWGVKPDAVIGHSMGEAAAAHIAGALSLEDAAAVIVRRSRLMRRISGRGAMAVVELSVEQANARLAGLRDRLAVAVSNSPRSTVIAGDPQALADLLARLEAEGIYVRHVNVDVASHSPAVDELRDELFASLRDLQPKPVEVPMCSTVTGAWIEGPELTAEYWCDNLRQPVRFGEVVQALVAEGFAGFVEASPHPILVPPIREALPPRGLAVGSLRREENEREVLLHACAELHVAGFPIGFEGLVPAGRVLDLPPVRWVRKPYWFAGDGPGATTRARRGHPLLGEAWTLSSEPGLAVWQAELSVGAPTYATDHRVGDAAVLPAAAYLEMAGLAARECLGDTAVRLGDVRFDEALILDETRRTVQVVVRQEGSTHRFRISSRADGEWVLHCSGVMSATDDEFATRFELPVADAASAVAHYVACEAADLRYGPAFRGLTAISSIDGASVRARVELPEAAGSQSAYRFHPALLDAALQSTLALVPSLESPWVPVGLGSWTLRSGAVAGPLGVEARRNASSNDARVSMSLRIVDAQGRAVAEAEGLELACLPSGRASAADRIHLEQRWERAELPEVSLAFVDRCFAVIGSPATETLARLQARGVRTVAFDPRVTDGSSLPTDVVFDAGPGAAPNDESVALQAFEWARAIAGAGYRDAPRLWWLTWGIAPVEGVVPERALASSPLWGLRRVLAYEHPELRSTCIDGDPRQRPSDVEAVIDELLAAVPEEEIARRDDRRFVAVLRRGLGDAKPRRVAAAGQPFQLEIDNPGQLDALTLRRIGRPSPGPGEVAIAVRHASLNFIDVMKALGIYPGLDGGVVPLGGECTGRVVAIGSGVDHVEVGQEVVALPEHAMASHVVVRADRVVPRPSTLSSAMAAACPLVFMTARWGLYELAGVRAGEIVLVHSAAGGTGLAAVALALARGARVFATAGSQAKREMLRGLGVEWVGDSRSLAFVDEIRRATDGRGVDVVLNSLSGQAIEANLDLLAVDGRLIELGKRDIYTADRRVPLRYFQRRIGIHAVDLLGLAADRPERFAALFRETLADLPPEPFPVRTVPISQAEEAFRTMAKGEHVGKLVLEIDEPERVAVGASVRSDGTYVISGGLGGLGISVAHELARRGAGHLVLLGRRGATTQAQHAALAELRRLGTEVTVAPIDVADAVSVDGLFADLRTSGRTVRGVVHAAGLLDDGLIAQQDRDRVKRVFAPKIAGAWNLHRASLQQPLDFFVLYASAAGLVGSPGQANYAAANTYLDTLAHVRAGLGLPALSIDWGPFSEVGLAAAMHERGDRLVDRGMANLTPEQGLSALFELVGRNAAQVGVVPLDARRWVEAYPQIANASRLAVLYAEDSSDRATPNSTSSIADELRALAPADRQDRLIGHVAEQAANVLRLSAAELDPDQPFKSLGIDSLTSLELRNRLEAAFGFRLGAAVLWAHPTIRALAGELGRLAGVLEGAEVRAEPATDETSDLEESFDEAADVSLEDRLARLEGLLDD